MNAIAVRPTYTIPERFGKALKLIRRAFSEMELCVAGEFDAAGLPGEDGNHAKHSRILLVDSPLLAFEAQALDRAAGVFFPLHVLVWSDGGPTFAFAVGSSELFDARLPSGAAGPIEILQERIAMALETVAFEASPHDPQPGDADEGAGRRDEHRASGR